MRSLRGAVRTCVAMLVVTGLVGLGGTTGCGAAEGLSLLIPGLLIGGVVTTGEETGGTTTGGTGGGFFGGGTRTNIDPCAEPQARKFVRISMRNLDTLDHIHYFLILIAYVNGETYPEGAVCPDDIALYTSFGYEEIEDGATRELGNYCIVGPALVYFHQAGRFRRSGGTGAASLGSAIAPAQGTNATFDNFFNSSGALVPVPNSILWHNPGTGDGVALKISRSAPTPCTAGTAAGEDDCAQDAFYYVDASDRPTGTIQLGPGSTRRVPDEIQGTGCECGGFDGNLITQATQILAPSGATASNAECNEFLRGGAIEYVFVREDTVPAFPQLLWRVRDQSGSIGHDFDSRSGVGP